MSELLSALWSGDSFMISQGLQGAPGYIASTILMLFGVPLILLMFKYVSVVDRYFERTIIIVSYLAIAGIIFVEVIRRFTIGEQVPWSTTLPPYLFLVMTWFGAAYNVRLRTHLSFEEVRNRLPVAGKFACYCLDFVLWMGLSLVVICTTLKQTANSASNFQILLGTDDVMQWWFYLCVPISWMILAARVLENFLEDINEFRSGGTLEHEHDMTGNG